MKVMNVIAWVLLVVGGLAWLLIGAFSWNFVAALFGGMDMVSRIVYILVGISALWLIFAPILSNGKITLWDRNNNM